VPAGKGFSESSGGNSKRKYGYQKNQIKRIKRARNREKDWGRLDGD
jgi:hypothetical protein